MKPTKYLVLVLAVLTSSGALAGDKIKVPFYTVPLGWYQYGTTGDFNVNPSVFQSAGMSGSAGMLWSMTEGPQDDALSNSFLASFTWEDLGLYFRMQKSHYALFEKPSLAETSPTEEESSSGDILSGELGDRQIRLGVRYGYEVMSGLRIGAGLNYTSFKFAGEEQPEEGPVLNDTFDLPDFSIIGLDVGLAYRLDSDVLGDEKGNLAIFLAANNLFAFNLGVDESDGQEVEYKPPMELAVGARYVWEDLYIATLFWAPIKDGLDLNPMLGFDLRYQVVSRENITLLLEGNLKAEWDFSDRLMWALGGSAMFKQNIWIKAAYGVDQMYMENSGITWSHGGSSREVEFIRIQLGMNF